MVRKGMGSGTGKGYKNIAGSDPRIHSQSASGIKQAQQVNVISQVEKSPFPTYSLKEASSKNYKPIDTHFNLVGKWVVMIAYNDKNPNWFEKRFLTVNPKSVFVKILPDYSNVGEDDHAIFESKKLAEEFKNLNEISFKEKYPDSLIFVSQLKSKGIELGQRDYPRGKYTA